MNRIFPFNYGFFPLTIMAVAIATQSFAQGSATIPNNSQQNRPLFAAEKSAVETVQKSESTFFDEYIYGRLQIGTRLAYRTLTDSDSGNKGGTYGSGTFLGTIYGLDENQSYAPDKIFMTYYFSDHFGFELAHDRMLARTLAMDIYTDAEKTDGDVILSGPTLSLLGRYGNTTPLTPYAGIGLGFFNGDFDETAEWAHSNLSLGERDRLMVVDSTTALLFTAGVAWAIKDHWFLDCSLQYIRADADATFYGYTDGTLDTEQTGHFPIDNVALRLGAGFSF